MVCLCVLKVKVKLKEANNNKTEKGRANCVCLCVENSGLREYCSYAMPGQTDPSLNKTFFRVGYFRPVCCLVWARVRTVHLVYYLFIIQIRVHALFI